MTLSTIATLGALVTGTLLEAFPYIVLGALVSALLEVFVPATLLQRLSGRGTALNIAAAALAGFVFPVCECGIIPVVARLRAKGMATGPLLAYLYAAPAVQPIVLYSTYVAFNDSTSMMLLRGGGSFIVALAAAFLLRRALPEPRALCAHGHGCHCVTEEEHQSRLVRFGATFVTDASRIFAYLTLGAAVAATVTLTLPVGKLADLSVDWPLLGVPAAMLLAFILSVCSEADAFVAYALVGVPPLAQLAFLWFGPVADIKLAVMYQRVFGWRFTAIAFVTLAMLVLLVAALVSATGVLA